MSAMRDTIGLDTKRTGRDSALDSKKTWKTIKKPWNILFGYNMTPDANPPNQFSKKTLVVSNVPAFVLVVCDEDSLILLGRCASKPKNHFRPSLRFKGGFYVEGFHQFDDDWMYTFILPALRDLTVGTWKNHPFWKQVALKISILPKRIQRYFKGSLTGQWISDTNSSKWHLRYPFKMLRIHLLHPFQKSCCQPFFDPSKLKRNLNTSGLVAIPQSTTTPLRYPSPKNKAWLRAY